MTNARNLADVGRIEGLSLNNAIINGNFDIWQRGASASGAGYSADRWIHNVAGPSGTVTQSRQAFTVGQTDVPKNPAYFYRIQGSSYTLTAGNISQKIEDVRTLAGETATVSFYAKVSAARQIQIRFYREFGVGGSTADSTIFGAVSLTTSWQKFVVTGSIPSISGKTIGDGSSIHLTFDIKEGVFGSDLGSDSIDIAQVKLEAGSVATPFRPRPIGEELALCQRYYQKIGFVFASQSFGGSGGALNQVSLPVEMRVSPTISIAFDTGTGGTLVNSKTGINGIRQNTLHSAISNSTVILDAEL